MKIIHIFILCMVWMGPSATYKAYESDKKMKKIGKQKQ